MEVGPSKESLVVIRETDVNSISGSLIVIGQEVLIACKRAPMYYLEGSYQMETGRSTQHC